MPITANQTDFPYLADNLRLIRVSRRLTQQQLADRAGSPFDQTYISRLERGLRPSDAQHVRVLASALGVDVSALLRRPRRIGKLAAAPIAVAREAIEARR